MTERKLSSLVNPIHLFPFLLWRKRKCSNESEMGLCRTAHSFDPFMIVPHYSDTIARVVRPYVTTSHVNNRM
jgi:hypothetical protein